MRRRLFCLGTVGSSMARAMPVHAAPSVPLNALKIGQSAPLSGPIASQVKVINSGAQLVFDRANKAGGIKGRQIELISLDDQLQPVRSIENCERLISEHGVSVLFGVVGSGNVVAIDPLLRRTGVPVVGGLAVSDSAREQTKDTAYYVRAGYRREVERLVEHIATMGVSRIALVHFANPGGEEVRKTLVEELARRSLAPAATAGAKVDGSNMPDVVTAIAESKPQAVILFVGGTLPAKVIAGLDGRSAYPSYYGMSIVPGELTAKELGARLRGLAISQVIPYPWSDDNVAIVEFRKLAIAAGVPVNYQSYEGYVTAMVLVEALKRTTGNGVEPAGVHAALKSLKGRVGGMDVDFSGDGTTGSRFVELVHVTGSGRFRR